MQATDTAMYREAREAPERVAALLAADADLYGDLGRRLRASPPRFAVTLGRGTSDNACTYAAYLLAIRCGIVTASLPMSLLTVNEAPLGLEGAVAIAVSQSGASPDLVTALRRVAAQGAATVAIVNEVASPLAEASGVVLPQHAGPEKSVAATKSFIGSLVAVARLIAEWREDDALRAALARLPERLEDAARLARTQPWMDAVGTLADAHNLYVISRGPGLAVAQEAALKLKETSMLHAEAFSSAEQAHGPRALVQPDFPMLAFLFGDAAGPTTLDALRDAKAKGAAALGIGGPEFAEADLSLPPGLHPLLDPIVGIQAFYLFAAELSVARGLDPDRPANLSKVTRTF